MHKLDAYDEAALLARAPITVMSQVKQRRATMSQRLRDAVGRAADVRDRAVDPALASAIEEVIAEAMTEITTLDSIAQDLAARISARQEQELVALHGPTTFSRAHLKPQLIVHEIMTSDLL